MKTSEPKRYRTLDVRPVFARGGDAFAKIMATLESLVPGEGLLLLSPFLPSPLIEKLQSDGFHAQPERRSDGSWQTRFIPPKAPDENSPDEPRP